MTLPLLSACAVNLESYQAEQPTFDLRNFFSGHLEAHGLVQDFRGRVIRRFKADILAQWQGDKGLLDEEFLFTDGVREHRCWQLEKARDNYTGTAADVVGQARGRVAGNTLNWQYTLAVEVSGKTRHIHFDDWMYLVDEETLINRAKMSKFGLPVGEVTLYIRKVSAQPHRPLSSHCRFEQQVAEDE